MNMDWLKSLSKPAKLAFVGAGFGVVAYAIYRSHHNVSGSSDIAKSQQTYPYPMETNWSVETLPSDSLFDDVSSNETSVSGTTKDEISVDNLNMGDVEEPIAHTSKSSDFAEQKSCKKVLLLGLEKSGKSRLLAHLSKNVIKDTTYKPTKGYNVVCISYATVDISMWEIGGLPSYRVYWRNFCATTDLVLFVIDSGDKAKFQEAKEYIFEIVAELEDCVDFHVVAMKADDKKAVDLDELKDTLGVERLNIPIHQIDLESTSPDNGAEVLLNCCLSKLT